MNEPHEIRRGSRRIAVWALSFAALVIATIGLHAVRDNLQQAHVVLVYLLIVLAGSAYGGRALGMVLAVVGFLLLDYFFQIPFDYFSVGSPPDWFVLVAFVITAGIAASLLAREQSAAERARRHTEEVTRLSRLGAELLGAGTAEHALAAIAEHVREAAGADSCVVFRLIASEPAPEVEVLVECGAGRAIEKREAIVAVGKRVTIAGLEIDGSALLHGADLAAAPMSADAVVRSLVVPLRVHDRIVGALGVASAEPLRMDERSRRLLDALTYYAALAVERVTLVAELEHVEVLREGVRVREALLASVSHDLRTPLTTIKVLAHEAAGETDLSLAVSNASIIEEQADRLAGIVSNLLDLTRLRSNAFPVHPDVNVAEDLVGAVARQVSGIIDGRALVCTIDSEGPILLGRFDFVHSQRILVNLIENAVRHSPLGAPIVLGASRDGDSLVFTVADSGNGIATSEREKIFEPFYRSPSAVADVGGIGLGLYIGRELAKAQGGSLTLAPSAGGGSTFVLRLACVNGTAGSADSEQQEEGESIPI